MSRTAEVERNNSVGAEARALMVEYLESRGLKADPPIALRDAADYEVRKSGVLVARIDHKARTPNRLESPFVVINESVMKRARGEDLLFFVSDHGMVAPVEWIDERWESYQQNPGMEGNPYRLVPDDGWPLTLTNFADLLA